MTARARLIEQAAVLCSAYAAQCSGATYELSTRGVIEALDLTWEADKLATEALCASTAEQVRADTTNATEHWARAESMLRNGEV